MLLRSDVEIATDANRIATDTIQYLAVCLNISYPIVFGVSSAGGDVAVRLEPVSPLIYRHFHDVWQMAR